MRISRVSERLAFPISESLEEIRLDFFWDLNRRFCAKRLDRGAHLIQICDTSFANRKMVFESEAFSGL